MMSARPKQQRLPQDASAQLLVRHQVSLRQVEEETLVLCQAPLVARPTVLRVNARMNM